MKRSSYIIPHCTGQIDSKEQNDCTVRTLANLTGIPYSTAYSALEKAGRKQGEGISVYDFNPVYCEFGVMPVASYGTTQMAFHFQAATKAKREKGCTVGTILRQINEEYYSAEYDYAIITKQHIFAVVNKKVIDKGDLNANRSVIGLYRFKSKKP